VVEIQRSRMLDAALSVVDELGYSQTTVAHITSRARVSRRTFYDLFGNREDCLLDALESVVQRIAVELDGDAYLQDLSWRERVRMGLWMILSFFDREPVLARVCVVQALRGGPRVLERREQVLAGLASALDEGRPERSGGGQACLPLTAQALVGAAFAVVYGRLLSGSSEPLTGLYGELMGMIVLPYMGSAAARREQEREAPVIAPSPAAGVGSQVGYGYTDDPLAKLPMRITYRTARVLETIAASPGISNREVGERSGVTDQGQISRLLGRLERLGLLANAGEGQPTGSSNAWSLTPRGEEVEHATRSQPGSRKEIQRRERGTS
jgi:AcrR family transcriptional regulator